MYQRSKKISIDPVSSNKREYQRRLDTTADERLGDGVQEKNSNLLSSLNENRTPKIIINNGYDDDESDYPRNNYNDISQD